MAPNPSKLSDIQGALDSVSPSGIIEGWCWSAHEANERRSVAVLMDGVQVLTVVCDQFRNDLCLAGVGDGAHGFIARLALPPAAKFPKPIRISIEDKQTGQKIGDPLEVHLTAETFGRNPEGPAAASETGEAPTLHGFIDSANEDGIVTGWCWDPTQPNRHVSVMVFIDGELAGSTIAELFREDLKEAGIGDGSHCFSFILPWTKIADKISANILICDKISGKPIGNIARFERRSAASVNERLQDLERRARLMQYRIDELSRTINERGPSIVELFATVGAFFSQISESIHERLEAPFVPGTEKLMNDLPGRYSPINLARPASPTMLVCVIPSGNLDELYDSFSTIHHFGIDQRAKILLLDDNASVDTVVLTTIIWGLHYVRVLPGPGLLVSLNNIVREDSSGIVTILSSQVSVCSGWLDEIISVFTSEPNCAVVGGKLKRIDGMLQHVGFVIAHPEPDWLVDAGYLTHPDSPKNNFRRPVAAFGGSALSIRKALFTECGGFEVGYEDVNAAAVDVCLKLGTRGYDILYQPLAELNWNGRQSGTTSDSITNPSTTHPAAGLLRHIWKDRLPTRSFSFGLGLFLDATTPDVQVGPNALIEQMCALRHLGYSVSFCAMETIGPPHLGQALQRTGIAVCHPPFYPSALDYLEACGQEINLVQVGQTTNPKSWFERIRAFAPQARIIWAPVEDPDTSIKFEVDGYDLLLLGENVAERDSPGLGLGRNVVSISDFHDTPTAYLTAMNLLGLQHLAAG